MTDRDQLLHLADRARRGVLPPDEGALLADAVVAMAKDLDFWKQLAQDAREAEGRRTAERDEQQTRAVQAEAARDRLRRARDHWADHAQKLTARAVTAEAANARVRDLHRDAYPNTPGRSCTAGCGTWPCPTTRALDEQQPTTEALRDKDGDPVRTCTLGSRCGHCGTAESDTQ